MSPDESSRPSTRRPVVVDIIADGPDALSVRWPAAGSATRALEAKILQTLEQQLDALDQAERLQVDGAIVGARQAVGRTLWDLLDGPERRLDRALLEASERGDALDIVVRLQAESDLAGHAATRWRCELMSPSSGGHPAADGRMRLVVQMGGVKPEGPPRVLEHGGLRVTLMAFSPQGVEPVLDYETEEDRLLEALQRPIEKGLAQAQVVEDGSLVELKERLADRPADVLHLTGHGTMTREGPRLVMEDALGRPHRVSPEDLVKALREAGDWPELVMISSCLSAKAGDGIPSFAAALVTAGAPAVLGWATPVDDGVATKAAVSLYERLCMGQTPAQAVAYVRDQLRSTDEELVRNRKRPSHAWGTLHLLMKDARGFRVDPTGGQRLPKESLDRTMLYRYLGSGGGMRVLQKGFVGRRRRLQRLLRIVWEGEVNEAPVAGSVVLGMKGVGKSCLVGRVLERHEQVHGKAGLVVLHGKLDEATVLQRFLGEAVRQQDGKAEAVLERDEPVLQRVKRLLTSHWLDRRVVIVLDDFEKNLQLRADGDAVMEPHAAALLEVLLPACLTGRPKLLVTTTASFVMPSGHKRSLAEVALGPFEPTVLRKLWVRLEEEEGRTVMSPRAWAELAERLGRNARVLDWAKTLLRGTTPEEVQEVARRAGEALPSWTSGSPPDEARVTELARLFLRTLAMEKASVELHEDAKTFVSRARVYEQPVPAEAFEGLVEGLQVELSRDITVLQNLGMLEVGEMDGQRAHRVSPLVEPEFRAEQPQRWHAVAARFWEGASQHEGTVDGLERVVRAWKHALEGQHEEVANRCGRRINNELDAYGLFGANLRMARQHTRAFPEAAEGLLWAGSAESQAGDPHKGWLLFERGEKLALSGHVAGFMRHRMAVKGANILVRLGRLPEAARRLEMAVEVLEKSKIQGDYAAALTSLAVVQRKQGLLSAARESLETAIAVQKKEFGTEFCRPVAVSLHELAGVLLSQSDLTGARDLLQLSVDITTRVFGTDRHPGVATSLHGLAGVLFVMGDRRGARDALQRSLCIKKDVFGGGDSLDIADTLHAIGAVLRSEGDLSGARTKLQDALEIRTRLYPDEGHPEIAASLHELALVSQEQGDLVDACAKLQRSLGILRVVHGSRAHPDVASGLQVLATVLFAMGRLSDARLCLERSLLVDVTLHGSAEHHNIATSLDALASVLKAEGCPKKAVAIYEKSLGIRRRILGTAEHFMIAETEVSLGLLLLEMKETHKAQELLRHGYSVLRSQTPNHPYVTMLQPVLSD